MNGGVKAAQVRLIDSSNNQLGIVDRNKAISTARDQGLDLVEVAPKSTPPVCRIMDYGKWLYQQKRKARLAHKKQLGHSTTLKEIRLRPGTGQHDLQTKLNHARELIKKGHKVQFTMFFRGRQMLHQDRGYQVMADITELLDEIAKPERPAKFSHRRMTILLVPR